MSISNTHKPKGHPVDLLLNERVDRAGSVSQPETDAPSNAGSDTAESAPSFPQAETITPSNPGSNPGPVMPSFARLQAAAPGETRVIACPPIPSTAYPPLSVGYRSLASTIDTLYRQLNEQSSDSPELRGYCSRLLTEARGALESKEYALAGCSVQQAKARLLRARLVEKGARVAAWRWILVWEVTVGLGALVAVLLPFYVTLLPALVPLLRAMALGALGGTIIPLGTLTHYLDNREYDPAQNAEYSVSPLRGALIGAVGFLLSELGVVAAPGALGLAHISGSLNGAHTLIYSFVFLAGVANNRIFNLMRGWLLSIGPFSAAGSR